MRLVIIFALLCSTLLDAHAKTKGFGPGEQDYGFANVRPGVHIFWWLYHTTADVADSAEKPLILWLDGGPGGSSCGHGNFLYVGPLDANLQYREENWVKDYNILFVDTPVGAGFSFAEDLQLLTTNNSMIARDLVDTVKQVFLKLPKFKTSPFYVYGISYGGKMATDFARLFYNEIQAGVIDANIKGVLMGNAWISPIDAILAYGPFLYEVSLVDENGERSVNEQAEFVKELFDTGRYYHATVEWFRLRDQMSYATGGIDIYNILIKVRNESSISYTSFDSQLRRQFSNNSNFNRSMLSLTELMNGPVKEALNIPSYVVWGSQAGNVLTYLYPDFMLPVTNTVESILNDTDIEFHVCNGNTDVIVSTTGVVKWINKLRWKDVEEYKSAPRESIWVNDTLEGYKKQGGRFSFYWLNVAGHDAINGSPAGTWAFLKSAIGE